MRHFNDPNWDFQGRNHSAISISNDGVEPKRWSRTSTHLGASTDAETGSKISSWRIHDSKADFSSDDSQVQWVSFTRRPYRILFTHFVFRDSPYPEVRAAVSNTDDPDMVVNTFRM
jgi:hypothetical protein